MKGFKKYRFVVLVTGTAIVLAGCSNKAIESIKSSPVYDHPSYTYGQLLDNRRICADTKWSVFKDGHQRNIVQYTCTYKYDAAPYLASIKKRTSAAKEMYANDTEECQPILERRSAELAKNQQALAADLSALKSLTGTDLSGVDITDDVVAEEKSKLAAMPQGGPSQSSAQASSVLDDIQMDQRGIDVDNGVLENTRRDCNIRYKAAKDLIEGISKSSYAKAAKETIQWVPSQDGYALAYGGLTITMSDGTTTNYHFIDFGEAFNAMLDSDADTAFYFIGKISIAKDAL